MIASRGHLGMAGQVYRFFLGCSNTEPNAQFLENEKMLKFERQFTVGSIFMTKSITILWKKWTFLIRYMRPEQNDSSYKLCHFTSVQFQQEVLGCKLLVELDLRIKNYWNNIYLHFWQGAQPFGLVPIWRQIRISLARFYFNSKWIKTVFVRWKTLPKLNSCEISRWRFRYVICTSCKFSSVM